MIDDAYRGSSISHVLPDGRSLNPGRARSLGILDPSEAAYCRARGIALAFDPLQNGYVTAACLDDISFSGLDAVAYRPTTPAIAARTRFTLRPWRDDEAGLFLALVREPEIWRYLPEPYPAHIDETLVRQLILISAELGRHYVLAIAVSDRPVGQVRLMFDRSSPAGTRGEISYWLGREHWGKRLGSEVVALFTHRCFSEFPDLLTIVAKVHRENQASARVLIKAGYRLTTPLDADPAWSIFIMERPVRRTDQQTAA